MNIDTAEEQKTIKNKNLLIVGIVVLVVATLVVSFFNSSPESGEVVAGCVSGDKFSQTTGEPCTSDVEAAGMPCQEGDAYNIITGEPCEK